MRERTRSERRGCDFVMLMVGGGLQGAKCGRQFLGCLGDGECGATCWSCTRALIWCLVWLMIVLFRHLPSTERHKDARVAARKDRVFVWPGAIQCGGTHNTFPTRCGQHAILLRIDVCCAPCLTPTLPSCSCSSRAHNQSRERVSQFFVFSLNNIKSIPTAHTIKRYKFWPKMRM